MEYPIGLIMVNQWSKYYIQGISFNYVLSNITCIIRAKNDVPNTSAALSTENASFDKKLDFGENDKYKLYLIQICSNWPLQLLDMHNIHRFIRNVKHLLTQLINIGRVEKVSIGPVLSSFSVVGLSISILSVVGCALLFQTNIIRMFCE